MARRPKRRTDVALTATLFAAVAVVIFPTTWWMQSFGGLVLIFLGADLIWRPWSEKFPAWARMSAVGIVASLIVFSLLPSISEKWEQSTQRILTEKQREIILDSFSDFQFNRADGILVWVESPKYDEEAYSYAQQIGGLQLGNNLGVMAIRKIAKPSNGFSRCLELRVADVKKPPDVAMRLFNALNEAGVKTNLEQADPVGDPKEIDLIIGPKPLFTFFC